MIQEQYFSDSNSEEVDKEAVPLQPAKQESNTAEKPTGNAPSNSSDNVNHKKEDAPQGAVKIGYMSKAQREKLQREREEEESRRLQEQLLKEKEIREEYEKFKYRDWKKD